jgi:ribonuclease-3
MMKIEEIESKIGYVFKNKALLETARTHSSYAKVHGVADNERLEYLGDAVLELLISEKQYFDGVSSEGSMTKTRQGLVSKQPLKIAIEKKGLKDAIRFVGGEDNIGDKTVSSLYESLLAAVYLDGGLEEARAFVARHPLGQEEKIENYKGALQEYLQRQGFPVPEYKELAKLGKDNAPTFRVVVSAQGKSAEGEGTTKRAAEQEAAKALLAILKHRK